MGEAREELGKRHTEWEEPGTVGSVVQLLAPVQLFAVPLTAGRQASLSFIISGALKLMSIESVMPSKHLILRRALLLLPSIFPSIRVFSNAAFASGGQRIGASVEGVQIGWQDRGGGAKGRSRGRGDALLEL